MSQVDELLSFGQIHFKGETHTRQSYSHKMVQNKRIWCFCEYGYWTWIHLLPWLFWLGIPQGTHWNPCLLSVQCYFKALQMKERCKWTSRFHKFSSLLALLKNIYSMWWNCYTATSKSNKYGNFQERTSKTKREEIYF